MMITEKAADRANNWQHVAESCALALGDYLRAMENADLSDDEQAEALMTFAKQARGNVAYWDTIAHGHSSAIAHQAMTEAME